jgi:hypothetical protein
MNKMLSNDWWVNEEIRGKIKSFLESNGNKTYRIYRTQ